MNHFREKNNIQESLFLFTIHKYCLQQEYSWFLRDVLRIINQRQSEFLLDL